MHKKFRDEKQCIFCDTRGVNVSKTKSKGKGFSRIFSIERSESYVESIMDCGICNRKYKAMFGTSQEFFKNHLKFSELVLSDLVRLYPSIKRGLIIDAVINNLIGVAQMSKKGQKFRPKEYNLVFEVKGKRGYLHCKKDKKDFKVISVNEV
ncbi:MAG TPA: hypothetical protein VNL34_04895 [Candidatus Nitrosotenuis sp.]|nr:hypothetical protein [Candidatus Nitrosotenuis sp.]